MTSSKPEPLAAKNQDESVEFSLAKIFEQFRTLILGAFGLGALVVAVYMVQFGMDGISPSREVFGQFGDYIGGILNPILSFIALLAILFTVQVQLRELRLTRDELERSSEALQQQAAILREQQFVTKLIALLDNLDHVTERFRDRKSIDHGYADACEMSIKTYWVEAQRNHGLLDNALNPTEVSPDDYNVKVARATQEFFQRSGAEFQPLLDGVIGVIEFILDYAFPPRSDDPREPRPDEAKGYGGVYFSMLESRISDDEFLILALYALTVHGHTLVESGFCRAIIRSLDRQDYHQLAILFENQDAMDLSTLRTVATLGKRGR